MIRYSLDENGRVSAIGAGNYEHELTDEPFSMYDSQDWQKNKTTGEWEHKPIIMTPEKISKLQAVSHLLNIDRYEDLMAALDTDETGVKRILFDAAHELYRDSTMVGELAHALGFTDGQIDELFIEANKILI